jgi:hypothetical protein
VHHNKECWVLEDQRNLSILLVVLGRQWFMSRARTIAFESFLDGITFAGLFGKLRWSGAPTEFVDSRSIGEFVASGEFAQDLETYKYAIENMKRKRAAREAAQAVSDPGPVYEYRH